MSKNVADLISMTCFSFWDYVEKQLAGRQAEAKLGGAPDVTNKIRAFVDLALKDKYLPTSMEVSLGCLTEPCAHGLIS
jgi:hypothetical protein